jgi:hypothetical protein
MQVHAPFRLDRIRMVLDIAMDRVVHVDGGCRDYQKSNRFGVGNED